MKKLVLLSVIAVAGALVSSTPAQAAVGVNINVGNPAPYYTTTVHPGAFYTRSGYYTGPHSYHWYRTHHHHYEEIF